MPAPEAKLSMLVNDDAFHGQLKSLTGAAGSVVLPRHTCWRVVERRQRAPSARRAGCL